MTGLAAMTVWVVRARLCEARGEGWHERYLDDVGNRDVEDEEVDGVQIVQDVGGEAEPGFE